MNNDRVRSWHPRFSGVQTELPGRKLRDCEDVTRAPHRLLLQFILVGGVLALTPWPARAGEICSGSAQYPSVSIQVDNSLSTPVQYYGNYCPLNSVSASLTGSTAFTVPYPGSAAATDSGTAAIGNLSAYGAATGTGESGGSVTVETSFNDTLMITGPSGPLEFEIVFDPVGSLSVALGAPQNVDAAAQMAASFEASDLNVATGSEDICLVGVQTVTACAGGSTPSPMMGFVYTQAGDEIDLYGELNIQVLANGSFYCDPAASPCLNEATASASAGFSGQFYIEALTRGAGYTSLSGASYPSSSSTPEPSSLVLLATALAALVGFAHRTARRNAAASSAAIPSASASRFRYPV